MLDIDYKGQIAVIVLTINILSQSCNFNLSLILILYKIVHML